MDKFYVPKTVDPRIEAARKRIEGYKSSQEHGGQPGVAPEPTPADDGQLTVEADASNGTNNQNTGDNNGYEGQREGVLPDNSVRQADAQEGVSRQWEGSDSRSGTDQAQPGSSQKVNTDERDAELEKALHRIRTLDGMLKKMNSDMSTLQSNNSDLQRAYNSVLSQLQSMQDHVESQAKEPASIWTEDDELTYGDSIAAYERKLKADGVNPRALAEQVKSLKGELAIARNEQLSMMQNQQKQSWDNFVSSIKLAVPDMDDINYNPAFVEYMNAPVYGTTRQALLEEAANKRDAQGVMQFYQEFKAATAPKQKPTLDKRKYTQPIANSSQEAPQEKPVAKRSMQDLRAELHASMMKPHTKVEQVRRQELLKQIKELERDSKSS